MVNRVNSFYDAGMADTAPAAPKASTNELREALRSLTCCAGAPGSPEWLRAVAGVARMATCGTCWARPGEPCPVSNGGTHLARFRRARERGILHQLDYDAVAELTGETGIVPAERQAAP